MKCFTELFMCQSKLERNIGRIKSFGDFIGEDFLLEFLKVNHGEYYREIFSFSIFDFVRKVGYPRQYGTVYIP